MAPDQKTEDCDRQARERNKPVAKDVLARHVRDQLADHPHRRQYHYVNRRMRIEPEQMLEQDRIASERRIEYPYVGDALGGQQQNRDCNDRRSEDHYQARRVMSPDEQREPKPRQTRRAHRVNRYDEVEPGQNRRKSGYKYA